MTCLGATLIRPCSGKRVHSVASWHGEQTEKLKLLRTQAVSEYKYQKHSVLVSDTNVVSLTKCCTRAIAETECPTCHRWS